MTMSAAVLVVTQPVFCVPLLVADRPRRIDEVIDYFGESSRTREASRPAAEISDTW